MGTRFQQIPGRLGVVGGGKSECYCRFPITKLLLYNSCLNRKLPVLIRYQIVIIHPAGKWFELIIMSVHLSTQSGRNEYDPIIGDEHGTRLGTFNDERVCRESPNCICLCQLWLYYINTIYMYDPDCRLNRTVGCEYIINSASDTGNGSPVATSTKQALTDIKGCAILNFYC